MKYIALLRGINVGGNNKVSMKELKACFEQAGFAHVSTYINSGNVLFCSEERDILRLTQLCEQQIQRQFGQTIRVCLLDADAYQDAMEHAPHWWGDDPESKHNLIYIIPPATAEEISSDVGEIKPEYEQLYAYGNVIFWSAPVKTFSRTRWSKVVGTKAYQNITIRNANTARRLLELSQS